MQEPQPPQWRRGLTAIDGAMALIVLLLIVQLWLLSATLESFLRSSGNCFTRRDVSGVMFLACLGWTGKPQAIRALSRRVPPPRHSHLAWAPAAGAKPQLEPEDNSR
jgi:hypothetical protein